MTIATTTAPVAPTLTSGLKPEIELQILHQVQSDPGRKAKDIKKSLAIAGMTKKDVSRVLRKHAERGLVTQNVVDWTWDWTGPEDRLTEGELN